MDPQEPMNPTGEPSIELDAGDGRGFQSIDQVAAQIEGTSIDAQNETENFPPNVKLRIDALKELQQEQAQLEDQFEKERRILELKYEKLYTPLYEKRAGIVSGRTKVDAEQSVDDNVVGIPGFWLRAFMNHSAIAEIIEDHDVPVFAYLMDVRSISHEEDNVRARIPSKQWDSQSFRASNWNSSFQAIHTLAITFSRKNTTSRMPLTAVMQC